MSLFIFRMCSNWLLVICFVYISITISCAEVDPEKSIQDVNNQQSKKSKSESPSTKSDKATTVTVSATTTPIPKPSSTVDNTTKCAKNDSKCEENGGIWKKLQDNKGMLLRTLYVIIGITSIVIIYFVIRAWRLRRRRSKSRKYGLITTRSTDLEMAPLDDDDDEDDEDMTVYEHHKLRK